MEAAARFAALFLLAECVHFLARRMRAAAEALLARAVAWSDRHVVVFTAGEACRRACGRDSVEWSLEAVLGHAKSHGTDRIADTALGLRIFTHLVRASRSAHLQPTVHVHVVADGSPTKHARSDSSRGGVHVHMYHATHDDHGHVVVRTSQSSPLLAQFPCKRIDLLVAYSGAHVRDDLLNFVVGTRPVEAAVFFARHDDDARGEGTDDTDQGQGQDQSQDQSQGQGEGTDDTDQGQGQGQDHSQDQSQDQRQRHSAVHVVPRGWKEYILQTARKAYLCSPDEAHLARFPTRCLAARKTAVRGGNNRHSDDDEEGHDDDEGDDDEEGDDDDDGQDDGQDDATCTSRSAAIFAFAAVVWYRQLRPWWEVALRQAASPLDVVAGCFSTHASPRFASVRTVGAHAYSPLGPRLLGLMDKCGAWYGEVR